MLNQSIVFFYYMETRVGALMSSVCVCVCARACVRACECVCVCSSLCAI